MQFLFLFSSLFWISCAILFGEVKPVNSKYHNFSANDIKGWTKKTSSNLEEPDLIFQSSHFKSTIHLQTACTSSDYETEITEQDQIDEELFSVLKEAILIKRSLIDFKAQKALEIIKKGYVQNTIYMMHVISFRYKKCIFDFISITPENFFQEVDPIFIEFIHSFELK